MLGGEPRERRLARARAGRRGPSSAARRTRARCAARSPRRAGAPGRRSRPACAGRMRAASGPLGGAAARPRVASSGGSSGASNRRSIATGSMVARRGGGLAHDGAARVGPDRRRSASAGRPRTSRCCASWCVERRRWIERARVRGRLRGVPAAARTGARRSSRSTARGASRAPPGALRRRPRVHPARARCSRSRSRRRAAGRPAGVGARVRRRGGGRGGRRRGAGGARAGARELPAAAPAALALRLAGAAATVLVGPVVVLVLLACGLAELVRRRGAGAAVHAWPLALPLAATGAAALPALAWTALKVGALSYGGGFVIVPLMQGDALANDWLTAGRVRQRGRLRADHAGPRHPHDRADRLGRGGARAARCSPRRSRSRRRSRSCCSAATRSQRAALPARARARSSTAPGPAAIGAILGAAVLLAGALDERVAVGGARGRRARPRAAPLAAARAARRRGGRAGARQLTSTITRWPTRCSRRPPTSWRGLIRFNTVNPPGDERACQEWLRDYLTEAGLECELDGTEPERPNLVATLAGAEPGPVLGYLSHVDTVLADAQDWTHDPWSGDDPRRPPVGPRSDRHEVPDGGRGRRGGAPGPRRLAAARAAR